MNTNASSESDGAFCNNKWSNVIIGEGVTSISACAFYNCSQLKSITIPQSLNSIGLYAFEGCNNLSIVNVSDLKSWCEVDIKNYYSSIFSPFYYGAKLYLNNEEVSVLTIPDGVTSIKQGVFRGCSSITEVIIPDSVTSIEKFAFYECKSLANVTLGKNVSSVGERAFDYCSLLTSIYCKPTTPPAIYYSSSTGSFPFNANLKIYVPQDSYSAYRQYSSESSGQTVQRNWCKYKSYIEAYDFE